MDADTPTLAKQSAIERVWNDSSLREEAQNRENDPPQLHVGEIELVEQDTEDNPGNVYYLETESEKTTYYVREAGFLSRLFSWWRS